MSTMSVSAEQVLLEVPQLQDGARVVNEVWWVSEKLMVCFALQLPMTGAELTDI
jgi:hypothetical protein